MRMTKLMGNWDFVKVTLRYGYFGKVNKKELVKAILQERATSQPSGGKHPTGSAELRKDDILRFNLPVRRECVASECDGDNILSPHAVN